MSPCLVCLITAILAAGPSIDASIQKKPPQNRKYAAVRLSDVDADFALQGEYVGTVRAVCGTIVPFGLQVVALGNGTFSAMGYQGGLPGNGWDLETAIAWNGDRRKGVLTFDGPRGRLILRSGHGKIIDAFGVDVGQVRKVRRISKTLGTAPPPNAIVLFDGRDTDQFEGGSITEEGWLAAGAVTKMPVKDFQMHLEFRTPYMPYARDQGRANSGVYIQQRYEVQILDSFGLMPVFNGCGALYRQQVPDLNMSFPPLTWQTYDIHFRAARWDDAGNKVSDARITVMHNGVAIHNDRTVFNKTGAGKPEAPEPGPIRLQYHGNPVRFRNVWLVDKEVPVTLAAEQVESAIGEVIETPGFPVTESFPACGAHYPGWVLWKG
jgi:hypothetical protein